MTHRSQLESRFLTREQCEELAKRVASFATGGGKTELRIDSSWIGNVRWGRNQLTSSGDSRDTQVILRRNVRGANAVVVLNEIDDASLRAAIQRAERLIPLSPERPETGQASLPPETHLQPKIWSDATYNLDGQDRAAAMRASIKSAEAAHVQSAGYLQVGATGQAVIDNTGHSMYYAFTTAQYSVTVRDPSARASGWAGMDHTDWTRIDASKLAAVALEKCVRSRDPGLIEPGRYTTILEPQAVCDFFDPVIAALDRRMAESEPGVGPFSKRNGNSKIGEKVIDERITITADPMDPDLGFVPFDPNGQAYRPATWIQRGVLTNLSYDRNYAIQKLGRDAGLLNSGAYRMSGGSTTINEMIATTRRGVLVTRLSNVTVVDYDSMLLTGYTRDGLWLIENGKNIKPIRNFRFSESPLFAFNNIEQIGPAVRVFHPQIPVVVPVLKILDFSFIGIADAV